MRIAADRLYRDGRIEHDMAVEIDRDRILSVGPLDGAEADVRIDTLMPACVDLQVNGGGGVMLNSEPTAEGMRAIRDAHASVGTGAILPTVITDEPNVMEAAADAALACQGEPGLLGLHIEGPHINPVRRGTHAERFIRPLDRRTLAVLKRLRAAGIPVILTLAPEVNDASLIAEAAAMGVVISAGHSAASAEQTRAAIENGVRMFTHLFNGMPQMVSRDPGIIAAAILSDCWCGMIADGVHVRWEMLRIAMAARPRSDRCFLVSDAMATVGGPDHFNLYGQDIYVDNGRLVNSEGSLAGAAIDMVTGLANLHHRADVPLERAIAMATDLPRAAIGLDPIRIAPGLPAREIIALDSRLRLQDIGGA